MRPAESLDFKLDRWAREAKELATCTSCYGVGERPSDDSILWGRGRVCEACSGRGRAAREPHVLELVELLRSRDAEIARAADRIVAAELEVEQLRLEVDRLRVELYRLRDERQAARAEVERLRGIVEVNDQRLAAVWDEARAEVERLRDDLHRARHREGED